jgi:hypothetical protein
MRRLGGAVNVERMADDMVNDTGDDDTRNELARVERQIAELQETAHGLRAGLNDAGPTDAEDRSQAIYEAEQQEAISAELEMRRDELRRRLGST